MKKLKIMSAVVAFMIVAMPLANTEVYAESFSIPKITEENKTIDVSGDCSATVTWHLVDGTLTISGNGEMNNWFSLTYIPWKDYLNLVKTVVIESGVTNIGMGAFANMVNLSSITIPDTVTAISANTFYNCSSLRTVVIPASVTAIGKNAFQNAGLSSITIMNPNCQIYGDGTSISARTIYGYSGSTAETYAKTYGKSFALIGSQPITTTSSTTRFLTSP